MSTPPTRFLWVSGDNKPAKKVISAHAVREGLRKKKRAHLTHFANNTAVLKRPLSWREIAIRPNTLYSQSIEKSTVIESAAVDRGGASSTKIFPLHPHNVTSRHSARKIFQSTNAGPQSLLSARRSDPFGTYPVSGPAIRFGQLLDFCKCQLPRGLILAFDK
jgi:hypothetical protein